MMQGIQSPALDFIEDIDRNYDLDRLSKTFGELIENYGFHTFIMTGLPAAGHDVEPLVMTNKWPAAWADRYREGSYFADDPVSVWSLMKDRAFRWRQAQSALPGPRAAQINSEASDMGLVDGLGIPIRNSRQWRAVVSLAADRAIDMSISEAAVLETSSVYFHLKAQELVGASAKRLKNRLSAREREVLHWCAAGKTAWEIGEILSISEGTAKLHRNSAIRKLDAANTIHAVVIAISLGELQP